MPNVHRIAAALALASSSVAGQQAIDSAYTRQIRELTPTDARWKFTTELVDHLPASATVPTPLKVLGYVPGTIGRLAYVAEVNRYFKAVADASPRTRLFSLGMSDEGKEMIALAIADEETIRRLDDYRAMLRRLADPRGLAPAERARLVREAKPVYWLTGAIHSPETGSPEMLLELAYRLAVDDGDFVRSIRSNVITLITPVTEVDGRDRAVDTYKLAKSLRVPRQSVPLVYWGKYTAHDNNRDGIGLSQKLTQHMMQGFLYWRPTVMHDLHESVPFLYTSTGTGPYNDEFDPIVVNEWHQLAYQEINELTKRGLPGIWTHGFYDGWAPNYMLSIPNLHNSIGKFYETYTSSGADCHTVRLGANQTERRWDRFNPPVNGVKWCIRSNINFQQSGVMIALKYVGDNRQTFLDNFVTKSERQVRKGQTSAPYAFVIPRGQQRAAEAADLMNLFRQHGAEVHVASTTFDATSMPLYVQERVAGSTPAPGGPPRATNTTESPATRNQSNAPPTISVQPGDWIIRLDQPYSQTVRTLLAVQRYKGDDPNPYDDTGWTLQALRHVQAVPIADSAVLARPMTMLAADAQVDGTVSGTGATLLVRHVGDWRSAVLPWKIGSARVQVADTAFTVGNESYPAGTQIVADAPAVREAIRSLGLTATAATSTPTVRAHEVTLPRIAYVHSWLETQNEGWVRYAFDRLGIPYTYMSDQTLKQAGRLDAYDVVIFPHVGGSVTTLLNGRPMTGPPIPWKKTTLTPHLGRWDETDDVRPGMGLEGAAALRRFVERGGLLITEGNTSTLPVQLGFNATVSLVEARTLRARGAIFRGQALLRSHPVLYGYDQATFPIYFNQAPLLSVTPRDTSANTDEIDPAVLAEVERLRGRVVLRFHERADSLLISGLLEGGQELAGRAAIVDAPVGQGHVLLFAIRPFWRWQTQGTFALALNAMAHWNALGGSPRRPTSSATSGGRR